MKHKQTAASLGAGLARGIFPLLAALLFLALTEWVARGELTAENQWKSPVPMCYTMR